MHVKPNIAELRVGSFKVAHSENGKRMVLYYGFREIVRFSYPLYLMDLDTFLDFLAGAGKSILWFVGPRLFL